MKKINILILSLLLSMTFCVTEPLLKKTAPFKPQGSTIAVIAGLSNTLSRVHAEYLTLGLHYYSQYTVIPQKKIAANIKNYPYNIQGPYDSVYTTIAENYRNTDKSAIADIQKQIGARYVLVVWTPYSADFLYASDSFPIVPQLENIVQLYEFNTANKTGAGDLKEVMHGKFITYYEQAGPNFEDAVRKHCNHMVRFFAKKTNMQK